VVHAHRVLRPQPAQARARHKELQRLPHKHVRRARRDRHPVPELLLAAGQHPQGRLEEDLEPPPVHRHQSPKVRAPKMQGMPDPQRLRMRLPTKNGTSQIRLRRLKN